MKRASRKSGMIGALVVASAVAAWGQEFRTDAYPPGRLQRVEDLPAGRLRTQLLELPGPARGRALERLRSFHFTEQDLPSMHADREGGILYACHLETGVAPAGTEEPAVSAAAVPVSPFPSGLVFHSKPGAPNVLFLNFCGETVANTDWNTLVGRTSIPALAFSTDSDYATFSDAEQLAIRNIWLRMAEDYAPFDIDVTTERPAVFGTRTAHALITRSTDANGQPNPHSTAGGVAYVNVFGNSTYAKNRPAWIYPNNLSNNESFIAEAASHEIGHNMGLSHDGRTDGADYYAGHGSGDTSWGPIMGTGYNRNVSQWCRGEYYLANNTQDDITVISGKIAFRPDDHGNTSAAATPLVLSGGTGVVSTTLLTDPARINGANKGVLERGTDVDVFSFQIAAGAVDLAVDPWIMPSGYRGGNVDVRLELYNAGGAVVATNDPGAATTARIQATLPAGFYYLHVKNTGVGSPTAAAPSGYTAYGGAGQYFIRGILPSTEPVAPPPSGERFYSADMETDPAWTLEPLWQFGVPASGATGPSAGYTGPRVIGYNLSGNYENRLSLTTAATPAIDAFARTNLVLRFRRWLRLASGDTASIEGSTNGVNWVRIWSTNVCADSAWVDSRHALPPAFEGSTTLRLRWGIESGSSGNDIGWNLDDVELWGQPAPVPVPMVTVRVAVNNPVWGQVSVTNAAYPAGTLLVISAVPNTYYRFAGWSGCVTEYNSDLFLELTNDVDLCATFEEIYTTLYEVPHAWLAAHGYMMFEFDVLRPGLNGLAVWQSYVAGLDPKNPDSHYRIEVDSGAGKGAGFTIRWPTLPGRLYTLFSSTNLEAGFAPVPGAVDMPPETTSYTDPGGKGARFYKIGITRP